MIGHEIARLLPWLPSTDMVGCVETRPVFPSDQSTCQQYRLTVGDSMLSHELCAVCNMR